MPGFHNPSPINLRLYYFEIISKSAYPNFPRFFRSKLALVFVKSAADFNAIGELLVRSKGSKTTIFKN